MKNIVLKVRPIKNILSFDEINVFGIFYNANGSKYKFGNKNISELDSKENKIDLYLHEDNNGFHLNDQCKKGFFAGAFTLYKNSSKDYDDVYNSCLQFISTLRKYNYGKIKETVIYEDGKEIFTYDDDDTSGIILCRYGVKCENISVIHERKTTEEKLQWKNIIKNQWLTKTE
jgi:hypothetical protein